MKASLFLMFAGAAFALSSCQEAATPTATEPVAPPAPPIKVSLEKNEIGSVVYGGGIAPASMAGKTITFSYANAKKRSGEYNNNNKIQWGSWSSAESAQTTSYTFANGNVKVTKGNDGPGRNNTTTLKYVKTGTKTAKLSNIFESNYSDGGGVIYELTFTTPTSGTAKTRDEGYEPEETIGITFTIN